MQALDEDETTRKLGLSDKLDEIFNQMAHTV